MSDKNVIADFRSNIERGEGLLSLYIMKNTIEYNTIKTIADSVDAVMTVKNTMIKGSTSSE
jgi:hypothetical protein